MAFTTSTLGVVALAEKRVMLIEKIRRLLGDEKLAAIRVRPAVGHRQPARTVEIQVGIELIVEQIAGIAHSGSRRIAALNHELRNDAMKDGAVVIRLVVFDSSCVAGSVQSLVPCANAMKLATAFGACF